MIKDLTFFFSLFTVKNPIFFILPGTKFFFFLNQSAPWQARAQNPKRCLHLVRHLSSVHGI